MLERLRSCCSEPFDEEVPFLQDDQDRTLIEWRGREVSCGSFTCIKSACILTATAFFAFLASSVITLSTAVIYRENQHVLNTVLAPSITIMLISLLATLVFLGRSNVIFSD